MSRHRTVPAPLADARRLAQQPGLTNREAAALRIATRHETALGSDDFVQQLEQTYSVRLRGRPPWTAPQAIHRAILPDRYRKNQVRLNA